MAEQQVCAESGVERSCGFLTSNENDKAISSKDGSTTIAEWLDISHELRTPANAILGHLDLLLSGSLGPLSSEARQSLGDIQKASFRLLDQIQKAIETGQRLSFPTSDQDKEIEILTSAHHQARKPCE